MKHNKLILIGKILLIAVICFVSFIGVYKQNLNKYENKVKEYTLSKDLKGYREVILKVSDAEKVADESGHVIGNTENVDYESNENYTKLDEKVNKEEDKTKENYEKVKEIIQKRLEAFEVYDYDLSVDKKNGTVYIQIADNNATDQIISNLIQTETIEIRDNDDPSKILVPKEDFEKVTIGYGTVESGGTVIVLMVHFNEDGAKILKDLSENEYKTIETSSEEEESDEIEEDSNETENENVVKNEKIDEDKEDEETEENKEEVEQKKVAIYISGVKAKEFSFSEVIEDGVLKELQVGQASTNNSTILQNQQIATIELIKANNGPLPLAYTIKENRYVKTDITYENIKTIIICVSVIVAILLVYQIVKYKEKGIISLIYYLGFIAILLLVLRYFDVTISTAGIIGIAVTALINWFVSFEVLKTEEKNMKKYNEKYLSIIIKLIPIFALSIILCFSNTLNLASFGMVGFWGILIIAIYNRLINME